MSELQHKQYESTLREYEDGYVDEVFKRDGDEFSMGDLIRDWQSDPVAADAGSLYVQTVDAGPNGEPVRQRYYFDGDAFYDPQKNQAVLMNHPNMNPDNPAYNIRIGHPWNSPLGRTSIVEAVSKPWTHGYDSETTARGGRRSPTAVGRVRIDQALGRSS